MADKEIFAFPDPSIKPDDGLIASKLGPRMELWKKMLDGLSGRHKDITWDWNYYRDGSQWLFKVVQKKKTILWGAILSTGEFRITFYFSDKAEPVISGSSLPEIVKENFRTAKKYGLIRPATLLVNTGEDVETIFELAAIRVKMK